MATGTPRQNIDLRIGAGLCEQLHDQYYAVVDDFIPQQFADQLLRDAERLDAERRFQQHYFQFGGVLLKKQNVFELDLSDPSKIDASNSLVDLGVWKDLVCVAGPSFVKQIDELDRAGSRSSSLSLETDTIPAIKMQLNAGGGSFPWHYDNPGQPNKRILTCVVYLNPKWKEGDGGEIVLCPFLSQRIVIPPLHRRAVLFFSDRVLHRVLPSNERRMCFTIWCNGKDVNARKDVVLSKDQLHFRSYDEAQIFFAKSPLQRVISRAVYSDEYLESLLECLASKNNNMRRDGDSEGLTKEERSTIIKQHEMNVLGITSKLRPLIEEFRRRKDNSF